MANQSYRDKNESARKIWMEYGSLFEKISAALFQDDPIGINFESNFDEYDAETSTILPRLRQASSVHEAEAIVYEEFCNWFGPDVPRERFKNVSAVIWQLWCEQNQTMP